MRSNTKGRALTVEIFHDPDVGSPCDEECTWRLYSFSSRHRNYRDPGDFFPDGKATTELSSKLEAGLAWVLSYFEHGDCVWMLSDEPKGRFGGDWQWDGVNVAGVLVWEHPAEELGPRTKEERRADAAAFVETYTGWCNGETYGYSISDSKGRTIDESWGFIGTAHLVAAIRDGLDDGDEISEVRDQVAGLTVADFRQQSNL